MALWYGNVSHEAAASCRSRYLNDEDVVQGAAGEVTRQRQVQCPPCLLAQLSGLLFYPTTSVSISMLGLLKGPLKFRIV
jgi:hypothetical protein